ncbi:TonB-dependent receptor [Cellvibrio sp. KY-GH-1]|uniref:TonB-dependent receptor plug domain-containing protein n=1 Tax=Cellvibrio sp. KY-GH-1 TaxID=2303332 RepID=UPI001248B9C1|nr:TonB-dependent receptor plug domain-containing protein [Cellvibrio sp. KY-GH-1]QEY17054.1 TonB-dependent receptor [Cellvibrio sp. KY-GH-1]
MMVLRVRGCLLALCVLVLNTSHAIAARNLDARDLFDLSLSELMDVPVDTASNLNRSWRAQPGIITLFELADMRAMGARTLRDVLIHIPGVSLGMDTQNAVNLVVRGNWAFEGKIQYIVNDMPVNDLIYGTFPLPPNFPVEQLERIEVLRGPGSVKYGNSAQLAVIRIYTRTQSGIETSVTHQPSANIVSLNAAERMGDGKFALSASLHDGNWGEGTWIDAAGTSADISSSDTQGGNFAGSIEWGRTRANIFHLQYSMDNIQQYGIFAPSARIKFRESNFFIEHKFVLNEQWQLTPRLSLRDEANWRSSSQAPDLVYDYDVRARAWNIDLETLYEYANDASLSVGVSQRGETARAISVDMPPEQYFPPDGELTSRDHALYVNWDKRFGDYELSLGARASSHDYSGDAFTPRIGLTRAEKNWHMKMLYGTAFREPDLQTSNPIFHPGTETLNAEKTRVSEIEYGHALGDKNYLTLSVFDQNIKDAIIYSYEPGYTNNPEIRTQGAELQYWYTGDVISMRANVSYARANDDDLPPYDVPKRSGQNMGAASGVANLWFSMKTPIENLSTNFDFRYLGSRYARQYSAQIGAVQIQKVDAEKSVNLAVEYRLRTVHWTFAVNNLTNTAQVIPQPYNDVSTPFPVGEREYWLRAEFTWR